RDRDVDVGVGSVRLPGLAAQRSRPSLRNQPPMSQWFSRVPSADCTYPARALRWVHALPRCIAAHTRAGVAGISMWSTPTARSASTTAFITAGGAPIVPDSPTPLMPSGLVLQGTLLK